jgi:hypothetical protein
MKVVIAAAVAAAALVAASPGSAQLPGGNDGTGTCWSFQLNQQYYDGYHTYVCAFNPHVGPNGFIDLYWWTLIH